MSFLLNKLATKKDIDIAIKTTVDKVLVLRFGRESDAVCLQLDDVVLAFKLTFWPRRSRTTITYILVTEQAGLC